MYLIKHYTMQTYGGSRGMTPHIFILGTRWRWSASRFGRFNPWETAPSTYCAEGWVDSRAGLDAVAERKKFLPLSEIE